ncbi:purine/pyrimidine permease [Paenibacillus koleovorans]|uniref:purine/pyrimidine permease n=1 Tax=Paenibacillus koleovorans TaxID=121608 RepID=UPI000FD84789|nr:purine/pyrimidine permease [Paenibacillus koleovorans]
MLKRKGSGASLNRVEKSVWMQEGLGAVQWMVFLLANSIAVPIVLSGMLHSTVEETVGLMQRTLLVVGVTTFLQVRFGHRLPIADGPAGIWTAVVFLVVETTVRQGAAAGEALRLFEGGMLTAGLVLLGLNVTGLIRRMLALFSSAVTGTYMLLLGVQLSSIFLKGMLGVSAASPGIDVSASGVSIGVFAVILVLSMRGASWLRGYSVIVGIAVGWVAYTLLAGSGRAEGGGGIGADAVAMAELPLFELPQLFAWGWPAWNAGMTATAVLIAFVLVSNTIASAAAVGRLVDELEPGGSEVGRGDGTSDGVKAGAGTDAGAGVGRGDGARAGAGSAGAEVDGDGAGAGSAGAGAVGDASARAGAVGTGAGVGGGDGARAGAGSAGAEVDGDVSTRAGAGGADAGAGAEAGLGASAGVSAGAVGGTGARAGVSALPLGERLVARSILASGVNQWISALFSTTGMVSMASTAGFVRLTRAAALRPLLVACVLLALLACFPLWTGYLGAIPGPVASAAIMATLIQLLGVGLQSIAAESFDQRRVTIIGVSLLFGGGLMFLPAESLQALPSNLQYVLGNGLIVGTALCAVLERVWRLRREGDRGA